MAFNLAEAFVTIGTDTSPLKRGLRGVRGLLSSGLGVAATAATGIATAAFAAMGAGVAGALAAIPLVKLGSDLEEMRSKFTAVFKDQEEAARQFAETLSNTVGRSQIEIEGFMSGLQDLFVPMGFARDQARELSQSVTQLGIDLASFNNMTDEEAIQALNAGLTGSHEVLKRFGVFINDNVLSLKLQEMGLAKNAQVATEQAKALARLAIIQESTTDAQGDAARTSGSLANQWKALKGNLFDLASNIGAALVPAVAKVVGVFRTMVDWVKSNQDAITGFITAAIGHVGNFINWVITLGKSILQFAGIGAASFQSFGSSASGIIGQVTSFLADAFEKWKLGVEVAAFAFLNWQLFAKKAGFKVAEAVVNLGGRVKNVFENMVVVVKWAADNWRDIAFTAIDFILTAFINLGQNVRTVFSNMMKIIAGEMSFEDILKGVNTDLTEGFHNSISTMPQFKEFVPTDMFDDALSGIDSEIANKWEEWRSIMEENAIELGVELPDLSGENNPFNLDLSSFDIEGEVKKNKGKSGGGEKTSLQSAFDKVQKAALSGQDKVPEQQLKTQQDIAAGVAETNRILSSRGKSDMAAVLA